MMRRRILDYKDEVMNQYENGITRGNDTGFKCLDELLSFKLGYQTFFLGFAGAGKTEIQLELLFNQSERYGWKHGMLSGEIGNTEDVIAELISKRLRKPFLKSSQFGATEKEVYQAMAWLDEHFYPMNGEDEDYTIESFYAYWKQLEKDLRIKLQTTSIDPFNDLDEELAKYANREDKFLAWALKATRKEAKINNWHNIIVTHAKDMPPIILKDLDGQDVYCTAVPTLNSFAGGPVWGRRAYNVVAVWRPEHNRVNGSITLTVNPATGMPFQENEAVLKILKAKPKGTAKKGATSIFFDWKRNRYYEDIDGQTNFAFEHEKKIPVYHQGSLVPNAGF